MSGRPTTTDVDWERLDKRKFFLVGAGLFSGLTACLYPLSVVKTRQMALDSAPRGLSGAVQVARSVVATDGVRGLYRGFGTVVVGIIPARGIYLTTLEAVKSASAGVAARVAPSEAGAAALANFAAGATASLITQSVVVPIDVVSQRLMVAEGAGAVASGGAGAGAGALALGGRGGSANGLRLAQAIVARDGLRGLYRGFGASIVTFVPSSAVWWSSYGGYQKLLWQQLARWRGMGAPEGVAPSGTVIGVQTASALLAGITSATLTNPLDVIKTRLQVAERAEGQAHATFRAVATQLIKEQGLRGLTRGLLPRIANVALWGTCMVSAYEFLKRLCELPEPEPHG